MERYRTAAATKLKYLIDLAIRMLATCTDMTCSSRTAIGLIRLHTQNKTDPETVRKQVEFESPADAQLAAYLLTLAFAISVNFGAMRALRFAGVAAHRFKAARSSQRILLARNQRRNDNLFRRFTLFLFVFVILVTGRPVTATRVHHISLAAQSKKARRLGNPFHACVGREALRFSF